jgi:hypothetical protein
MAEAKAKEKRTIEVVGIVPYELALGPTWTKYFQGFKEGKILATRCKKCNRVLLPARPFCPRCFVRLDEWVELPQEGTITTWTYVNYTYFGVTEDMIPEILASIKVDGADTSINSSIGGFNVKDFDLALKKVQVGTRVRAVWREEKQGNPRDIMYWEPIE